MKFCNVKKVLCPRGRRVLLRAAECKCAPISEIEVAKPETIFAEERVLCV